MGYKEKLLTAKRWDRLVKVLVISVFDGLETLLDKALSWV